MIIEVNFNTKPHADMKKKNYTTPRVLVMYAQLFSMISASDTSTYKVNVYEDYGEEETVGDIAEEYPQPSHTQQQKSGRP